VTAYPFLSPEWFSKVAELVEEHGAAPGQTDVLMNVVVTGDPSGTERRWHMGARDGRAMWGEGLLERADVTLTTDYETAKDVFVAGDPAAGMTAFLSGKVTVQGDLTKLMLVQAQGGGPPPELHDEIRAITQ
jgi:SCP-2 sterol transfer family